MSPQYFRAEVQIEADSIEQAEEKLQDMIAGDLIGDYSNLEDESGICGECISPEHDVCGDDENCSCCMAGNGA